MNHYDKQHRMHNSTMASLISMVKPLLNESLNITEKKNNVALSSSTEISYDVENIIELILLCLLIIFIILGNCLVCYAFSSVEERMRTLANYYIVSLAVTDLLVGVLSVPFWMWVRIKVLHISSEVTQTFMAIDILCGTASILNLTTISLERLCAVTYPVKHRNLSRSKSLVYITLVFIWVYSILFSGLYYIKVHLKWKYYTLLVFLACFVLPSLITSICYGMIFKVGKKHASAAGRRFQRELKLAMTIGLVILVFIICWAPFFILNMMVTFCTCRKYIPRALVPIVKLLHYANSMMNPIIYAYRNPENRTIFKKIFYERVLCNKFDLRPRSTSLRSNMTLPSNVSDERLNEHLNAKIMDYDESLLTTDTCLQLKKHEPSVRFTTPPLSNLSDTT